MKGAREISPTCEVVMCWKPLKQCGVRAVAGYPANGGGWMALCTAHAQQHGPHVHSLEDIQSGVAEHMVANRSRG